MGFDTRVIVSAQTINTTATYTSPAVEMKHMDGSAMAVEITITGTGPVVTFDILVAKGKNATYHTAKDGNNNSLSRIVASLAATRWIQFDPPIGKWFKILVTGEATNDTDTVVTVAHVYGENL